LVVAAIRLTAAPSNWASPLVGEIRLAATRDVVVLPKPLGSTRQTISPRDVEAEIAEPELVAVSQTDVAELKPRRGA
jgi:hypothetical protein